MLNTDLSANCLKVYNHNFIVMAKLRTLINFGVDLEQNYILKVGKICKGDSF